jgi:hypothetical protein
MNQLRSNRHMGHGELYTNLSGKHLQFAPPMTYIECKN